MSCYSYHLNGFERAEPLGFARPITAVGCTPRKVASRAQKEVCGLGGPPFVGHALLARIRPRPEPLSVSALRVTIAAAYCFCLVRASVRSRPELARSMMGSGEARSSKLTARAAKHRDRNGLTFPTSSAEQMATPERSLSRARDWWLAEAEVRACHPHAMHDDSQLSGDSHASPFCAYALGELNAPRPQNRPFLRNSQM